MSTDNIAGINKNAQMWFMDFVIGMLIFSLVLITYYTYTTNISRQDTLAVDDLISDAKTVSSSLTGSGYPDNWNSNTVVRIGFTDNNNKIDNTKFSEFNEISYNQSKNLFGTSYDYFLYFVNESGNVQNVEGFCGTGIGDVNITYDISAAYYYQNREEEQFLKAFMSDTFGAALYCDGGPKCDDSSFSDFKANINNYDFIVVEHPAWSNSEFNSFESAADPWIQNGGILFAGGQLASSNQHDAFGVEFNKKSGQSESDRLSTIVNEDEFVSFNLADNIVFRQAYYIEDVSVGASLKDIARFNGTWVEFNDIKANGDIALARWSRGDGKILFFSDFDADYLAGNFQEILEGSAKKWSNAACSPINISNIKRDNLVRVERLLVYNYDPVKMILYMWQ